MPRRIVAGLVLLGAAAVAAYRVPLRRWYLTWGATPDEVTGAIPGDDLLPEPDMLSTRAVIVGAPASAIWPWLVQMGSGRGGAYTYDWIENLLGLNMHSVDEVLPQYQSLQVGDVLPGGPTGPFMTCAVLEKDRALVWRSDDGRWIWSFLLRPDVRGTRLISRNRIADPGASPLRRLVDRVVMEPGSLVMERKMLLGIKQRAERLAAARSGRPKPATVHHADRTADRGVPAEGQRRLRGDGRFPMDRLTSVHGGTGG